MNSREKTLAAILLTAVVGGVVGMLYLFWYAPSIEERQGAIAKVEKDIVERQEKLKLSQKERGKLERYKLLSLPPDVDLDRREYEKYLADLLNHAGFSASTFRVNAEQPDLNSSPKIQGKKDPIYTVLPFTVQAHGSLASITKLLEEFYHTGFLHRIKGITIQRPLTQTASSQSATDLDLDMKIEALAVAGAPARNHLLPHIDTRLLVIDGFTVLKGGPPGLALIPWILGPTGPDGPGKLAEPDRKYAMLTEKNIFTGPPPPPVVVRETPKEETATYIYLTDITKNSLGNQAFIYDRYTNKSFRVRGIKGFDTFVLLRDPEQMVLVQAATERIDDRDFIFRVQLNAAEAKEGGASEDEGGFHTIGAAEWKQLETQREFRGAEQSSVFRASRDYWDSLIEGKIVKATERGITFNSPQIELLRGKMLKETNQGVYISLEKKLCVLHVGTNMEDALKRPLKSAEIEKLGIAPLVPAKTKSDTKLSTQ